MNIRKAYLYLSLVIVHTGVAFLALPLHFARAGDAMFANWGDGYKNYFTLYSYVKSPVAPGDLFKYNSFAYPFGDYVFYTDNTPLFAMVFRWLCRHVCDLSAYTIPFFNAFIIGNIVLASLLVFFVFRRLLGSNAVTYCLACFLPWVNVQVPRIWDGDFNLSCATPVLGALALFLMWYDARGGWRRVAIAVAMPMLMFLSFLLHGYYIAIVAAFISALLFFSGLLSFRRQWGGWSLALSLLAPAAGLAAVLGLLHMADGYLGLRPVGAMCYDCGVLKTNFLFLFTHYDFHSLAFPVASTRIADLEGMVYLGNTGLFVFGAVWIGVVCHASFRRRVFSIQKRFFADPLLKAIFFAGLVMLMISFGEQYTTSRDPLTLYTPFPWFNHLPFGTQVLWAALAVLVVYGTILAISREARAGLKRVGESFRKPGRKAAVLVSVAAMIYLFVGQYSATLYNVLNPFFYLHFLTREVEQFRSLSRFIWPFFWVFYIWIMYLFIALLQESRPQTRRILLALFVLTGVLEVSDYVRKARAAANEPNLLSAAQLDRFGGLKTDYLRYQAILPIPYYIVGSEDYAHTIDDNNEWTIFTTQLSVVSGLPLMSCKMSRTPPLFSVELLDMVASDSLLPVLRSRLNGKPVLVAYNRRLVADPTQVTLCTKDRPETVAYYLKANAFISRHHLQPVDSLGEVLFYSWQP